MLFFFYNVIPFLADFETYGTPYIFHYFVMVILFGLIVWGR